jgi:hypothetical protein
MGAAPLPEEALDELPRIPVCGVEAPLVSVKGPYTGMAMESHPDYMLLGTVVTQPDHTLFAKLIGPEALVCAARDDFIAFCASLEAVE